MFVLDDLLIKPFVSILDVIHAMAIDEMYDREAIMDDIKENQLLFELGDRSKAEYERRKSELEAQLEAAERAHENVRSKVEVMG
ncbi:gas vesicle protein GvpG [Halegenticoccus tardaugens]|uniref:gas vesicle protein GvpG n=1 Tax=Halegenticoccus tardaugens TaxID=2071624 RepID=UPI00100C2369|nr:protein gvpG [Halegenticoccus tardaugens]